MLLALWDTFRDKTLGKFKCFNLRDRKIAIAMSFIKRLIGYRLKIIFFFQEGSLALGVTGSA